MDGLSALKMVDFDWTTHLAKVWIDQPYDVPELNGELRSGIREKLALMTSTEDPASPLGIAVIGQAGAGKTHLVSAIRRIAALKASGFILVDMTDVHDFWETVLLGYISSLHRSVGSDEPQYRQVLWTLKKLSGSAYNMGQFLDELAVLRPAELHAVTDNLLENLVRQFPEEIMRYQDVIRALALLNSRDLSLKSLGYAWLQGQEVESDDCNGFKLHKTQEHPSTIVKGLSWAMSLKGPTVLALDQLDAIVTQHHLASLAVKLGEVSDELNASLAIMEKIGGGLGALRDHTLRSLVVVSCLEQTWDILRSTVLSAHLDRFEQKLWRLRRVTEASTAREMIRKRLFHAYNKCGFTPPYPTWPFKEKAFETAVDTPPRHILKLCESLRQRMFAANAVTEIDNLVGTEPPTPPPPPTPALDIRFKELMAEVDPFAIIKEDAEDQLGDLLRDACRLLVKECPPPDHVDAAVDSETAGGKAYTSLHSRVKLIHRNERDKEEHFCVRILQRNHPLAYQARLKAALTASGIDRALKFRRLVIIRTSDTPTGVKSKQLTQQFSKRGGLFLSPDPEEVRSIMAIAAMEKQGHPEFDPWLSKRKLLSKLKIMCTVAPPLCAVSQAAGTEIGSDGQNERNGSKQLAQSPSEGRGLLILGRRLVANQPQEPVSIPLEVLKKHIVVLAGAGSGKTVLVRRIVEEVALLGVPSIVVDCANDLARMGDRWPQPPDNWQAGDPSLAEAYHQQTEVVVWTPGKTMGNPLVLDPLPDLASLADEPDDLEAAVGMARGALGGIVAPGNSTSSRNKLGVLTAALKYFAEQGRHGLSELIDLLSDLPDEAGAGIRDAYKLAQQMADSLRARTQVDVLLRQTGTPLDPAILFGMGGSGRKTRVSVINFAGLPDLEMQRQFLNQLSMTLFSWLKKNPCPSDKPLRGLLVIDEAKDFVPSTKSTACKGSLQRLAAQGRKYGLGLLFATQSPKDIEHTIIQNCFTQFYGQASSPAAQDVIREQLRSRKGSGEDIPRLGTGRFYVHCPETMPSPTKILVPLCLSYHPPSPLGDTEVLDRAMKSKQSYRRTP